MAPEIHESGPATPPAANGLVAQPGLIVGLCAIALGLIGFSIPVLGTIASCIGIWLGIGGFRHGRSMHYTPGVACGLIGISVSVLSIIYWVCAILFESYH
jgi:hypothetical protein